jgi:Flp pilus assembly pilin Flp
MAMQGSSVNSLVRRFIDEEGGQAITEYGATLAFVSIMIAALFGGFLPLMQLVMGKTAEGLCNSLNQMAAAATM